MVVCVLVIEFGSFDVIVVVFIDQLVVVEGVGLIIVVVVIEWFVVDWYCEIVDKWWVVGV